MVSGGAGCRVQGAGLSERGGANGMHWQHCPSHPNCARRWANALARPRPLGLRTRSAPSPSQGALSQKRAMTPLPSSPLLPRKSGWRRLPHQPRMSKDERATNTWGAFCYSTRGGRLPLMTASAEHQPVMHAHAASPGHLATHAHAHAHVPISGELASAKRWGVHASM